MTNATTRMSAREAATKFLAAKSAKAKTTVRDYVAACASTSKRVRWGNLLSAIDANDLARVQAYAAVGEAKREAWAAVKAANAPAKPKATPAKAKAKAAPAKQDAAPDINALAQALASMDETAQAAFLNAFARARG
jgi:hypothetical protein